MSIFAIPLAIALTVIEVAAAPPPAGDLCAWAEDNIVFGNESPFPGAFRRETIPQLESILGALSPDHPANVVTVRGAAQIFKTTVAQVFIAGRMDIDPCFMGYVHATHENAVRWARGKWKKMRMQSKALRRIFGEQRTRDSTDTTLYQETRDGRGSLQISGSNSSAGLSMVSWPAQVQDDLSKWEDHAGAGDPEGQADARSASFEWRKVFKISTPLRGKTCRITRAFKRGTQEWWNVPCPHCRHEQPLAWENFQANIDPKNPDDAHFTCRACNGKIERRHKRHILAQGRYVAENPSAKERSFQASRAEMPNYDWAEIARKWIEVQGDPAAEQEYLNDWWGLPYETAGEAPPWTAIRDRANGCTEDGEIIADAPTYERGVIPPGGLIQTAGVDCQGDRIEVHYKSYGENLRRWTLDYIVIPHHISTEDGRKALDQALARSFPDAFGNFRAVDALAIDGNAYTKDVFSWAKKHHRLKVIVVRGSKFDNAPPLVAVKEEKRPDGKSFNKGRGYHVGVSGLKSSLYEVLKRVDPLARGYCGYPIGLADEFYRQLTAEKRVVKPDKKTGFPRAHWDLVHERNEVLDTEMYAEAAAIRCGWYSMREEQWAALRAEREKVTERGQQDLFDPAMIAQTAHQARPSNETAVASAVPTPPRGRRVLSRGI